jgi:hypothetical protein
MMSERRHHTRVASHLPVKLDWQDGRGAIETLTTDIGAGGVRCLSPLSRPVSAPVSIELTIGSSHDPILAKATVSWFQPIPGSEQFYLGITFDRLSDRYSKYLSGYIAKISRRIISSRI